MLSSTALRPAEEPGEADDLAGADVGVTPSRRPPRGRDAQHRSPIGACARVPASISRPTIGAREVRVHVGTAAVATRRRRAGR
jgi:hypothetical protein